MDRGREKNADGHDGVFCDGHGGGHGGDGHDDIHDIRGGDDGKGGDDVKHVLFVRLEGHYGCYHYYKS